MIYWQVPTLCFRPVIISRLNNFTGIFWGGAPLSTGLHNSLATVLDRLGRHLDAVAHYNKALSLHKDFIEARFVSLQLGEDAEQTQPPAKECST